MQHKFLGLLLAVLGNTFIGLSFSTVKYAHVNNPQQKSYLRLKWWWIGTALMGLGEMGNLLAYAVAKPALISPLGAVSVVVNAPAAYFVLGEKLSPRNAIGGILCILGGVGIVHVVAGQKSDSHFFSAEEFQNLCFNPSFLIFLIVTMVESVELILSKRRSIIAYVLICSFLGAVTVLSIKGLSSFIFLSLQGENQFWHPLPWILVPALGISVSFQIHYLNMSMAQFGTGEVVPVYYVLFTASAVIGSAMLYRDLDNTSLSDASVFLISLLCTSFGVYLVAKKADTSSPPTPSDGMLPLIGALGDAAASPTPATGYSHVSQVDDEELELS